MMQFPIDLSELGMDASSSAAFVGAGGKTSALFALARTLPGRVIVTTSTKLGARQADMADGHYALNGKAPSPGSLLFTGKVLLVYDHTSTDGTRLIGLGEDQLEKLHALAVQSGDPLLIEADGAKMLPLKAPGENEPVIPAFVTHVFVLAGLSALGKPLDEVSVFRPGLFGELAGLERGDPISLSALAAYLAHPRGGQKAIPPAARKILLLNQADQHPLAPREQQSLAGDLASFFNQVYLTSLKQHTALRLR